MSEYPITFIKSGLGVGGASLADIDLLMRIRDVGHDVSILTGYVDNSIGRRLTEAGVDVEQVAELDQRRQAPSDVILDRIANIETTCILSQVLCERERNIGQAAITLAQDKLVVYRQHDGLSETLEDPYRRSSGHLWATSRTLLGSFLDVNPNNEAQLVPPLIDEQRFSYTPEERAATRQKVRECLGMQETDLLLFQPTRVDTNKGIDYSISMASALETYLKQRVILLVAGGGELGANNSLCRQGLELHASALNFDHLVFLNGNLNQAGARRMADVMVASDAVAFPSAVEGFGLGPAEAALCRTPIFAREYVNNRGAPIFKEIYGQFNIISENLPMPSVQAVEALAQILLDNKLRQSVVEHNYNQAFQYTFSEFDLKSLMGSLEH